jgi:hypothetical protein
VSIPTTWPCASYSGVAGVAGLDGCVRRDEPGEVLAVGPGAVTGSDVLVEGGHLTRGRGRPVLVAGVADPRDRVTYLQGGGLTDVHRCQPGRARELQDRHVVRRAGAHQLRGVAATGRQDGDLDVGRAVDDVVVRQHLAGGREHHPGLGRLALVVAHRREDVDHADELLAVASVVVPSVPAAPVSPEPGTAPQVRPPAVP